eukprot:CAMPEP_0115840102 /NCGR_PEP_ID=MMETSP0287-20121206/6597_1 /TAXON_ID=412157 /ORGANISM="Chrysochromulina rotalis, Strain UIO044" /LENGTH=85 /DNA_ID=CAMNT_0003293701 /DNA_START=500 /DNA_END=757 /DNA_ORIENTATION=+
MTLIPIPIDDSSVSETSGCAVKISDSANTAASQAAMGWCTGATREVALMLKPMEAEVMDSMRMEAKSECSLAVVPWRRTCPSASG